MLLVARDHLGPDEARRGRPRCGDVDRDLEADRGHAGSVSRAADTLATRGPRALYSGKHVALRIGIDIGGTFTDLVALDEATGAVVDTKALSTPQDLLQGILRCVDQAGARLEDCRLAIHGTTIGINALLERKGARTGLVTTEGFRDVLEIGRGNFLRMYDVLYRRPTPLVPRGRRLEVGERMARGARSWSRSTRRRCARRRGGWRQRAWSRSRSACCSRSATRSTSAARPRSSPGRCPGCRSRSLTGSPRSGASTSAPAPRWSTPTCGPIMDRYLGAFERGLAGRGFRGQLLSPSRTAARSRWRRPPPSRCTRSSRARPRGPSAARAWPQALGADRLISFDMGGTTAKCAIVAGGLVQTTDEYHVDGHPLRIPVIDITEVSAGGGTIAWIDAGGALALGPQSAGADPGPVCYGRGGDRADRHRRQRGARAHRGRPLPGRHHAARRGRGRARRRGAARPCRSASRATARRRGSSGSPT